MKKLFGNLSLLAACLALCSVADAQVYTKFGPANGVLKGSTSTFQTTAAASTDVVSLWSGTCDATHFLAGNGTCAIPAGTGVTSVGLTVPSWYSVTGSPVTTSGTLAITAATGQTANSFLATPNGSTGAVSLRTILGADLPPINLGSTANGGVLSSSILLGTNGGTSNGFFSVTGPTTALRTFTFPNASATVLTSNAAVTVAQGGTGLATLTANGVMIGEGTSNPNFIVMGADTLLRGTASADPIALSINNCGSSTAALSYSTSTHTFGCQTISAGGTPGGSDTQVQYNSAGAFAGSADFIWNQGTTTLNVGGTANGVMTPVTVVSGAGKALSLVGGIGSTNGGAASMLGRNGAAGNNNGGDVTVGAGNATGSGTAGNLFLNAGNSPSGTKGTTTFTNAGNTTGTINGTGNWNIPTPTSGSPMTIAAGVGAVSSLIVGGSASGNSLDIRGPTTGATSRAFISFSDSAGSRNGYAGTPASGSGNFIIESDQANINLLPLASTGSVNISFDGGGSLNPIQVQMTGAFTTNASTCSFTNVVGLSSCSRTGVGTYTFTAIHAPQNCVGNTTPNSGTASIPLAYMTISGTTVTLTTYTSNGTTNTAADLTFGGIHIICE